LHPYPEFTDYTRAFLARLNVVVFPNSYTDQVDPKLKPRMEEIAKSGALTNWALEGLRDLRQCGHFVEPVASITARREVEEVTAPTVSFVRECCTIEENAKILTEELFDSWRNWCGINGHRPGSQDKFGRWLLNSFPGKITHTRLRKGKTLHYCYSGVVLTDAARRRYTL
jgi:putative DNA primase/helicase